MKNKQYSTVTTKIELTCVYKFYQHENLSQRIHLLFLRLRRFTKDHVRFSESGNENISSSNRPSTLESIYQTFYDHERVDALECLESLRNSREKTNWTELQDERVACRIFEV